MKQKVNKSRVIIGLNKLTERQLSLFDQAYPEGYASYIQKINKPSGDVIYAVPFETEDTIYMVKVSVKVDAKLTEDEFDKEILHNLNGHASPGSEEKDEDEDEKSSRESFVLVHSEYADDRYGEVDNI